MSARLLGAHMPSAGSLGATIRSGAQIGCTAVQVFTTSPKQWASKPATPAKVEEFQAACRETGISSVVCHDIYLVNLASPDEEIRAKSFASLKAEMERCAAYGIPRLVSHIGACKGQDIGVTLDRARESILAMLGETPDTVVLLMETTAGQGSDLNSRFEELAILLEITGAPDRLGVCLDTCHIFAAGYDIRTPETYSATMDRFASLVGFDRLHAVHANDSQKGLGMRVDRHAPIGEGEIGLGGFRLLVNDPRLEMVPILLETPGDVPEHAVNLKRLQDLRERSESPRA